MLSKKTLRQMSRIDILKADKDTLAEADPAFIDLSLPIEERFHAYLKKTKNPYLFLCSGVKVKIAFSDSQKTLDNGLVRYFSHLKSI